MEAEARAILIEAVSSPIERSLVDILLGMRDALAGEQIELPARAGEVRDPFG
jgi:plasmid stability protein